MEVDGLLINQIIEKLKLASENKQGLTLTSDEVAELYKELDDLIYIPVVSMEELIKQSDAKKK